jgi:hypothetical protein
MSGSMALATPLTGIGAEGHSAWRLRMTVLGATVRQMITPGPSVGDVQSFTTLPEIRRRKVLTVNHANAHRQVSSNPLRIQAATGIEMPTPVARATYAARHMGHFGSSARIAVGTIHLVLPSTRRVTDFPGD